MSKKKSIHRQLAEDLLVFQMCYSEQRHPLQEHRGRITHWSEFFYLTRVFQRGKRRNGPLDTNRLHRQLGSEWRDEEKQKKQSIEVSKPLTMYFLWHLACDWAYEF